MNAHLRGYIAAHGDLFLASMSDPTVTAHISRIEATLPSIGARPADSPFTVAALVVPAHMHQTATLHPTLRWHGYREHLDLTQLTTMVLTLNEVEVALVGMGRYITETRRRAALHDLGPEVDALAVRALQVAFCLGWDPALSPFDARILAPAPSILAP